MQGRYIESSYFIGDSNLCRESNTVLHYPDLNLLTDRRMELTKEHRNCAREKDTEKNDRREDGFGKTSSKKKGEMFPEQRTEKISNIAKVEAIPHLKTTETAARKTVRGKQAVSSKNNKNKGNSSTHPRRTVRTVSLLFAILILSFLFGKIGVHADPKEVSFPKDLISYKVITVEYGDTLWEIADCWYTSTDDDIRTYIKNVQEMNHLNSDQLQEGQLLLIYYGTSVEKETPNKASQL